MSTRAMIGRRVGNRIEGRYHHFDGYISGLGAFLHDAYRSQFKGDLALMQKILIEDHPAGWSNIIGTDLRLPAGFNENRYGRGPEQQILAKVVNAFTGEPVGTETLDPMAEAPACYCHGDRSEPGHLMVCRCEEGIHEGCDPLFTEYMYVLGKHGLEIWTHEPTGKMVQREITRSSGFFTSWEENEYHHVFFRLIEWGAPFNGDQFEEQINALYEAKEAERLIKEALG